MKVACKFHRHRLMETYDDKAIPAIVDLFHLRQNGVDYVQPTNRYVFLVLKSTCSYVDF